MKETSSTGRAWAELARIYMEADARIAAAGADCRSCGTCCDFDKADHVLYATDLETSYLLHLHGLPAGWDGANRCPYRAGNLCTARAGRTLGCRTYFCDPDPVASNPLSAARREELQAIHEKGYAAIKELIRRYDLPHRYSPLLHQLPQPRDVERQR